MMATEKITVRHRIVRTRNHRPGLRLHSPEWQVVEGRKILSRHDTEEQAVKAAERLKATGTA